MNGVRLLLGCLAFAVGEQAAAQCDANTRIQQSSDIRNLLEGQTVCGTGVGPNAGDQWQEWHQSGGTLTEYAKGPNDPVDPTHDVGSWSTTGGGANAAVVYTYDNSGPFSFAVHDNDGGNYSFCDSGAEVATAFLRSGQGPCSF